MRRRLGLKSGADDAERAHIFAIDICEFLRDGVDRITCLAHRLDDLVVYIGDVAGVDHMIGAVAGAQNPEQKIERHR